MFPRKPVPKSLNLGPVRRATVLAAGVGPAQLRGPSWKRVARGIYVWTGLSENPLTKLEGLAHRLPRACAFSGTHRGARLRPRARPGPIGRGDSAAGCAAAPHLRLESSPRVAAAGGHNAAPRPAGDVSYTHLLRPRSYPPARRQCCSVGLGAPSPLGQAVRARELPGRTAEMARDMPGQTRAGAGRREIRITHGVSASSNPDRRWATAARRSGLGRRPSHRHGLPGCQTRDRV